VLRLKDKNSIIEVGVIPSGVTYKEILGVIPTDRWITAKEIAVKLGINYRRVSQVINYYLNHLVEKRYDRKERCIVYRRIQ